MIQTNKYTTQANQTKYTNSSNETTTTQIASGAVAPSGETVVAKPKGFLRGLFDDLSMAQVISGALAAATVFLLSSVIGVAGSLIGAAIGSVISAVSSQVYKKALSASADKIRDASSTTLLDGIATKGSARSSETPDASAETSNISDLGDAETQTIAASSKNGTIFVEDSESAATRVMNANDIRYTAPNAQEVDPALRRAHERRNRKAKVQRQVLVVSVVSSLIAIVICAGVITFATQGEGIGTKTDPILPAITNSQSYSSQEEGTSSYHNQSTANDSSASEDASTSSNSPSGSTSTSNEQSGTSSDQSSSQGTGSTSGQGSTSDSSSGTNDGSSSGSDTGSGSTSGSGSASNSGSNSGTDTNSSSNNTSGSGANSSNA